MRSVRFGFTVILAFGLAATAHSENSPNTGPFAQAPHGLRFANFELTMPTDPLLWSSDPGWEAHHTPARLLSVVTDTLRTAIPVGSAATDAAALLHNAGAHCVAASASELACHYHDVETPFGGEYWDDVTWQVKLGLADGRVSNLAVTRDWTRR